MNLSLSAILGFLAAYLLGSFPTSYIFTRILKGTDIRESGSKNAGATNVFRVVGKLPGIITLIIDILKGVLAVTLIARFFYPCQLKMEYGFYQFLLGFAAICGHIWPVFLKFRGGKGVAATIGVAMVTAPVILLPSIGVWIAVFMGTGYVSLASILSFAVFPVLAVICGLSFYKILFSVIICSIVVLKHSPNIHRLINGEENKTKIFKVKI